MANKRNILIAGASGFLGQNVLNILKNSYDLILLEDPFSSQNYNTISLNEIKNYNFDFIINCAGKIKGSYQDLYASNADLPHKLARIAKEKEALFIHISSLNASLIKHNNYSSSKLDGEKYIQQSGLNRYCIIRPSYLFQEKIEPNLELFDKISFCFKLCPLFPRLKISCLLQPLSVNDLAELCLKVLKDPIEYNKKTIHIGGPLERDFWEMISSYLSSKNIKIRYIIIPAFFEKILLSLFENKITTFFQDKTLKDKENIFIGTEKQPF